jgi:hypothetical protein
MPISPPLLSLSDSQLTAIMAASKVLAPPDRETFLELLAQRLGGREWCDGFLYPSRARATARVSEHGIIRGQRTR